MSVFDEEITIGKLEELGFKSASTTQYENIAEFDILCKTIKSKDLYGPEATIFYFINKNEENVETIFLSTYSTTHFHDTVKDMIDMAALIHQTEKMLEGDIYYIYQYGKSSKLINLT